MKLLQTQKIMSHRRDKLLKKHFLPCVSSERGKPSQIFKLQDLKPFTEYSCHGLIQPKNVKTETITFSINCGKLIVTSEN